MKYETCLLDLEVRPNDLDSLAHVNNAVTLEYLEAGRWAWLQQHGFVQGQRVLPVVTRIEIDYRRELLPQRLTVGTVLLQPDDAVALPEATYKVRFLQEVLSSKGVVAVSAQVEVAFIDATTRSLASLQDFVAANIDASKP